MLCRKNKKQGAIDATNALKPSKASQPKQTKTKPTPLTPTARIQAKSMRNGLPSAASKAE
jgi:hypothetical protein